MARTLTRAWSAGLCLALVTLAGPSLAAGPEDPQPVQGELGVIEFREEALDALVEVYAQRDGGWREARALFLRETGEAEAYRRLDAMVDELLRVGSYEDTVALLDHLVAHYATAPEAVGYCETLLTLQRTAGGVEALEAEVRDLYDLFAPDGPWMAANAGDAEALRAAEDLLSSHLDYLANHHHRRAQAAEDASRDASAAYEVAASYYALFLARFPKHRVALEHHFFLAEIAFYERGDMASASAHYHRVLRLDRAGHYVEDALRNLFRAEVAMAAARPLVRSGKLYVVEGQDGRHMTAGPAPSSGRGRTELTPHERAAVAVADGYTEVLNEALRDPAFREKYPERGADIPDMMWIAANLFYAHGQPKEALHRLQVLFDLFPKHPRTHGAVELAVKIYEPMRRQQQRW